MKTYALTIAFILLTGLPTVLLADDVTFRRIALTLSDQGLILLDAEIEYQLNETVSEALENGVPLTFETHVQMRRAKAWIWEKDVVDHRLRTVLRYRPLSGLYELRNLQGDEGLAFATRDAALGAMGRIVAMPVIERERLDLDKEYLVRVEVGLDIEALPLPMRPLAYLDSDWSLSSELWEWRLRP
jgi:translation initiation factor IF-1